MANESANLKRLRAVVQTLHSDDIYRSVYTPDGELLAEGVEPLKQQLVDEFCSVDFTGKEVIDMGCSFGFFTFLAADNGAHHVTGIDALPEIVESAQLLAKLRKYSNVSFRTYNFEVQDESLGLFDLVMLVDFFGKSNIKKQKIESIVTFMESISRGELLFAIRPINRIVEDLKTTEELFSSLYPAEFIRGGSFYLLEYIEFVLGNKWNILPVSPYDGQFHKHKLLFLCKKMY